MGLIALIKLQDGKYQVAKHWPIDMPVTALEFDDKSGVLYAGQEDGNIQVMPISFLQIFHRYG